MITVTCSNGHRLRVKDSCAGKSGRCPHCHVLIRVPANEIAFEDEILKIVGGPSIHDGAEASKESRTSLAGSSLIRRMKECTQCCQVVSFAFTICPRCGTPLGCHHLGVAWLTDKYHLLEHRL